MKHFKQKIWKAMVFLFLLISSQTVMGSRLYEVRIVDSKYIIIHFKDQEVFFTDDGIGGLQALREYNFLDNSNNTIETYGDPLDLLQAMLSGNYTIRSTSDGNYTNGLQPVRVGRKSKVEGTQQQLNNGLEYETTMEHYIILELPNNMVDGAEYTLEINSQVESDTREVSFAYDYRTTRSDAIHVNLVGYSTMDNIKSADLYHWLGDLGPRDYSSFAGNKVFMINVLDNTSTEVGTVPSNSTNSSVEYNDNNLIQSPVWNIDLTGFTQQGSYRLAVEGIGSSDVFEIRPDIYYEPFEVSMLGYYFMRVGEKDDANPYTDAIPRQPRFIMNETEGINTANFKVIRTNFGPTHPQWSDSWDRSKPSENNDEWGPFAIIPESVNPDAYGGYSDARDWDRHLNHAVSIWDILLPYLLTDGAISDDDLSIPESGNGIPDIIDAAKHEVDFFYRLKDAQGNFSWGLANPDGIRDNTFVYQAHATAYSCWATAANCAMLSQAYQIAGRSDLMAEYRDKSIEAWGKAEAYTDQQLDINWNFGLAHLRGRDLKFMAAAFLYNVTGNQIYQDVVVQESIVTGPNQDILVVGDGNVFGGPGRNQLWGSVGYLMANKPYNNRTISNQTLYNNIRQAIINNAIQFEVGEAETRASRRATFGASSLYPTSVHVNRSLAAHAYANNQSQKNRILDALIMEADYTLGRNPLNWIQMTTTSTSLQNNKSVEDIYSTGSDDGVAGFHPGHTPYADDDNFGGGFSGDSASLLDQGYPSRDSWPVGEWTINTAHVFSHSEFTPQQTMRGKFALYGYLYGINGGQSGRVPIAPQYKLTIEGGTGSGLYAPGERIQITAPSGTNENVFQKWVGNTTYIDDYFLDDPTGTSATDFVTMPERGDLYLKATYGDVPPVKYQLIAGNAAGAGEYEEGEEVILTANNVNGQNFVNWTGDVSNIVYPTNGVNKPAIKIVMPASDITLNANFENGPQQFDTCGVLNNEGFEQGWMAWNRSNATLSEDARTGDWAALGFSRAGVFNSFRYVVPQGASTIELSLWMKTVGETEFSSCGVDYFRDLEGTDRFKGDPDTELLQINFDNTTNGWTQYSQSRPIPDDAVLAEIWVYMDNGQALFDDLCLTFDSTSPTTYTLNTISENGSVTLNPEGGTYEEGTEVTVTAVPDSGFSFDNWDGDLSGSQNPSVITMDGNKNIQANFSNTNATYTLNVTALNGNVTLSPEGGTYEEGTEVTVTAVPDSGFSFDNWDGDLSGDQNPSVIIMDSDKNIQANFSDSITTYSLNVTALNGNVTLNPPGGTYEIGTEVTVSAVANSGFSFNNWSGDLSGSQNPTTIIMDSNKNVTANFESNNTGGGDGEIVIRSRGDTGDEIIELRIADVAVATFDVTTNYSLYTYSGFSGSDNIKVAFINDGLNDQNADKNVWVDWIEVCDVRYEGEDGVNISGQGELIWGEGYIDFGTISCNSSTQNYTINTSATDGIITLDPAGGTYPEGTVVTLNALPDSGFSFANWSGDISGNVNPIQIVVDSNKNISANFNADPVTYSLNTTALNGDVSLNPSGGTYDSGTVVTITALPDSGFSFANWSGDISGNVNPIQIVVDSNKNIIANFNADPITYSLNTTALNGNVSLNPSGGTYDSGTVVTITALPDSGYTFANWSQDLSGSQNPATITMDSNKDVTANFELDNTGGGDGEIVIRSRGDTGDEIIELRIADVAVATFDVTTNYSLYTYSGFSGSDNIKVAFINDGLNDQNADKNVWVDWIEVCGVRYEGDDGVNISGQGELIWGEGYIDFGTISCNRNNAPNTSLNGFDKNNLSSISYEKGFDVFSNPRIEGSLVFELNNFEGPTELTMINMIGQIVFSRTFSEKSLVIEPDLPSGVYLAVVKTQSNTYQKKIILNSNLKRSP